MDKYRQLVECGNLAIADMAQKCEAVFATHGRAHVGISGGADSDVMLDLCERVRKVQPIDITYDFIDTGLEYRATREHIAWLEGRYGVTIARTRAAETIPACVKRYGQPFISKMVSLHMGILQSHGFGWEDGTPAGARGEVQGARQQHGGAVHEPAGRADADGARNHRRNGRRRRWMTTR